jgi:Ca2+-binding RTX toxin-like protein
MTGGGGGADIFHLGTPLFDGGLAINADTHGDVITDFTQGQDKIDISAFCVDSTGVDRFTGIWLGTAPFIR